MSNNEWQPIETAPRDGTDIILYEPATVSFPGELKTGKWWNAWYGDETKPGWIISNCDEEYGWYIEATHWMPLPKPPKQ